MIKILVPVKRVIDPYVKIRVKKDNSGVEMNNVKMALNPFDEIAVEEAIRLKEQGKVEEIVVVSLGPEKSQESLRHALALGADRAIHCLTDQKLESLHIAKILHEIVKKESPECILLGKQAIDNDNNQVGQMLAALLDWPQATFASKIELDLDAKKVTVTREIDGGLETLRCTLPAVVTSDLRLNTPRYASLPNIMKAKQKPLDVIEVSSFGLPLNQHLEVLEVSEPPKRERGETLENVSELMAKLKEEQVI